MAQRSTVLFGSVAINGPTAPTNIEQRPRFARLSSDAGRSYSATLSGSELEVWTLNFDSLTGTQKADLANFFENTAHGPSDTFSYTHTDGETYTARFSETMLKWTRQNEQLWGCTIRLEITAVIS